MTNQIPIKDEKVNNYASKNGISIYKSTITTENSQKLKHERHKIKIKEKKEVGITTEYIGTETYYKKSANGNLVPVEVELIQKKVSHSLRKGWRRVYLEQFMELMTGLYSSNKKMDIIEFIINNLDSENKLTLTQAQVMEKVKVSKQTIVDTYKYLIENDFMKKIGTAFVVNPKYVCAFGSDKKNRMIAIKYSN